MRHHVLKDQVIGGIEFLMRGLCGCELNIYEVIRVARAVRVLEEHCSNCSIEGGPLHEFIGNPDDWKPRGVVLLALASLLDDTPDDFLINLEKEVIKQIELWEGTHPLLQKGKHLGGRDYERRRKEIIAGIVDSLLLRLYRENFHPDRKNYFKKFFHRA